jgi:hypothetical protein
MNIPRCPEENCGAAMVPLCQQYAEFDPVVYRCSVHLQWEIDEEAIRSNEQKKKKLIQSVCGNEKTDCYAENV